ncbi:MULTISPECIES: TetR/AcrR family transcriptional regulator [unclassified Nitratiruptor]|uniref:TetR/AcrR family transcriptional regulator n=1 Tax=unclassified Nitratiruptor TaxID=2624044 RepID=UPI00191557BB|nr:MULTISPECIES: TetR/AcrR family transcriptional regulator [unclassified Nitratiruptor]BCD59344.1 transcriptional regulator, TetR family [Nitratiruptor sp. YY08-10]BCD63268.1 transcriptional regulator, TetR family [Nitratiruptor sp. YY08-14]
MSKKVELLQIAAKHFSKFGYSGVSLDKIAREAGITKPAIYYHFKNKNELYEAVLIYRFEGLLAHLMTKIEGMKPNEKLVQYIEGFGEFLQQYPCFAAVLAHEFADNGKHMSDVAAQYLSKTLNLLTSILNEGIEKEEFAIENPMVVQMMIVSSLIMHQTTKELRKRVASFVEGYEVMPEPNIEDFAKLLARKMIKLVRKVP